MQKELTGRDVPCCPEWDEAGEEAGVRGSCRYCGRRLAPGDFSYRPVDACYPPCPEQLTFRALFGDAWMVIMALLSAACAGTFVWLLAGLV